MEENVYGLLPGFDVVTKRDPFSMRQEVHRSQARSRVRGKPRINRSPTKSSSLKKTSKSPKSRKPHHYEKKIVAIPLDETRALKTKRIYFLRWMKKCAERLCSQRNDEIDQIQNDNFDEKKQHNVMGRLSDIDSFGSDAWGPKSGAFSSDIIKSAPLSDVSNQNETLSQLDLDFTSPPPSVAAPDQIDNLEDTDTMPFSSSMDQINPPGRAGRSVLNSN